VRTWFVKRATQYGVAPNEVEDVAQEAWHKARRGLPSFAFRGQLRAWLSKIIWQRKSLGQIGSKNPRELSE